MRSYRVWRQGAGWPATLWPASPRSAQASQAALFSSESGVGGPSGPLGRIYAAFAALLTPPQQAYPTHVPLTPVQRAALVVLSSLGAAADPRRADLVAAVGETTGLGALRAVRDRMAASPSGAVLLAERPRITDASVALALELPPHTFGGAYAAFMGRRGFCADDRPAVRFVDDPELAYVAARLREVHDFWHVLFGCHTNVFGEVALKAVEFMQTRLPMAALAVAAGELKLPAEDRAVLNKLYLPWALRAGTRCADLPCLHYERHLEEDLEGLRARWRIETAPQGPQNELRKRRGRAGEEAAQQAGSSGGSGKSNTVDGGAAVPMDAPH